MSDELRKVEGTDLEVHPLCLGGNVFGWTLGGDDAFAVLDAYVDAGGNFIDTANIYSDGGSEEIIGRWLQQRDDRDRLVIATKVGMDEGGLDPDNVRRQARASLERLGTDRIDLYYAHQDDPGTPLEDTLHAFDALVREGVVRYIAASNYDADRLGEALNVADRDDLNRYVALQPHYNLVERGGYEGALMDLCEKENLSCFPYFSLARGFLTGKYRPGGPDVDSPRAAKAKAYLDEERGPKVLKALDAVAQAHDSEPAAVAIAWLAGRPTVTSPIASARTVQQLGGIVEGVRLELTDDEIALLTSASE